MFVSDNSLKWKDIAKSYPKAAGKFRVWLKSILVAFQEEAVIAASSEDAIEAEAISDEVVEQSCEILLQTNPRVIYDFFDSNGLFMELEVVGPQDSAAFTYNVGEGPGPEYPSRREAEAAGFMRAFEELNRKK